MSWMWLEYQPKDINRVLKFKKVYIMESIANLTRSDYATL